MFCRNRAVQGPGPCMLPESAPGSHIGRRLRVRHAVGAVPRGLVNDHTHAHTGRRWALRWVAQVFWFCVSSMGGSAWHAARGFFLSGCCCVCAAGCGAGLLYLLGAPGFVVRASALGMGCAGVCWCGFASCRVLCVLLCYCVLLLTCASVVPAPRCRLSTATFVS